ncbi:MAG: hypothetical protein QOG09_1286, partial [Solirubrobacterales bacterium]|nr:hypothetical protein [Solirubrobacterales bacterium]
MPALEDRVASLEHRLAQLERAGTRPRSGAHQGQLPRDVPVAAFEGRPVPSRPRDPAVGFGDVLGTRTLAWVGGAVVLLGLAFLFAMAIDRGWISEQMRVIGGVLFSGGLLAFAFVLRDRFGNMEAALAAGATAIAGFFAADLAAGSLYGLISDPLAIAFAAAIAVVGVAIGISWDRESAACLSLGGAVLAPLVFLEQITAGSLMVVATILAATAALFLWKRWRFAIGIVSAVAMSLAGFWIGMHLSQPALALTVAFVFSAVVTVTAVAFQLIWRKQPLVITTATLLLS